MNMKSLYPLIAVGVILFYLAIGLAVFAYAFAVRLMFGKNRMPAGIHSHDHFRKEIQER